MSNPLFNMLGGNRPNEKENILAQINQFRANFTGDPRQKVQELLNSGQMTQAQFNELSQRANQIMAMLK